jgi:hypothetical protein
MGAQESSLPDGPIELDDSTVRWLAAHQSSLDEPANGMGLQAADASSCDEVRRSIPCWLGGGMSASECLSQHPGSSDNKEVSRADMVTLGRCLHMLELRENTSRRCGLYRRTIYTAQKNVCVGEEVSVVHVYEVLPPLAQLVPLYTMGPKPVLGEYVDGILIERAPQHSSESVLEEAAEVFDQMCPSSSAAALSLEQLWEALGLLSFGDLLGDRPASEVEHSSQRKLAASQRESLRKAIGDEQLDRASFLRLVANLAGQSQYDGALDAGPGVDTNWAVTRYTFDTPGEHLISWHGLEHFAGWSASNELRINVLPKLPKRKLRMDAQPGVMQLQPPAAVRIAPWNKNDANPPRTVAAPSNLGGITRSPDEYVAPLRKHHYGKLLIDG